jgi:hypothetical protein
MSAPPTNGHRILVYGRDSSLLHTRRLVLAAAGYDTDTVSDLRLLRQFIERSDPPYELLILCHTVPVEERAVISSITRNAKLGLYQLQRMEPPPRLVGTASSLMQNQPKSPPTQSTRHAHAHRIAA